MKKTIFTIQKGSPLDPEDNRPIAEELHIHVLFDMPEIHAELFDWLDNCPQIQGGVQLYQYDDRLCTGVLDIAMTRLSDDMKAAIDAVANGVELFLMHSNIDAEIVKRYPGC